MWSGPTHFFFPGPHPGYFHRSSYCRPRTGVLHSLEGGVRDRRQGAASRRAGPSVGPSVEDTAEAGAQAREYYLELMPDRREPKPTKVLHHHDAGPVRGRQYELLWRQPGYGAGKKKWVGPDHMMKYPDLLENYNKVPHHVWYH